MMEKKVVLVTGASSGFGKEIAELLSEKGYKVYGTSRHPKNKKGKYIMLRLDVDSSKSVDSCIRQIIGMEGKIDVLINNAGYVSRGSIEEFTIDEAKAQFETNFFGVARVTAAVLPIMRKQGEGRIVNISSLSASIPAPFQGFYAPSKAALTSYSNILRMEVMHLGIKVSVVEPGIFGTNLFSSARRASREINAYGYLDEAVRRRIQNIPKQDPRAVARTLLHIIRSKSPRFRYVVGKEKGYLFLKKLMPESAFESAKARYFGIRKKPS